MTAGEPLLPTTQATRRCPLHENSGFSHESAARLTLDDREKLSYLDGVARVSRHIARKGYFERA